MKQEDMIRMANQIAAYFSAFPDQEAIAGITAHIRDFWEPRMVQRLRDHAAAGGEGLSPPVLEAVKGLEQKAA